MYELGFECIILAGLIAVVMLTVFFGEKEETADRFCAGRWQPIALICRMTLKAGVNVCVM